MKTIIHIFSSVDGRISGPFMMMPEAAASRNAYGRIREDFDADAMVYGSVTALAFAGNPPARPVAQAAVPEGDFLGAAAPKAGEKYVAVLDPAGEVWWDGPVLRRPGRPDATVVEVVTDSTPMEFLTYLRNQGVPYIIAGRDSLDCAEAVRKLGQLFGIETLLVCGGGMADWTFLKAGCVNEVSIVVAPVASDEVGAATIFDQMPGLTEAAPVPLKLLQVSRTDGDGVHLLYGARR